jgi:hypothetical protein
MGQLPIENGHDCRVLLEKVSDPVVAMHDRPARRQGAIFEQPFAAPVEQRIIARRRTRQ